MLSTTNHDESHHAMMRNGHTRRGRVAPRGVMPPESAAQVPSAAEALAAAEAAVRAQAERAAAAKARAKAAREAAELEAAAHAAQVAAAVEAAAREAAATCYSYSELSEQVHGGHPEEHGLAGRGTFADFDRPEDLTAGSLPAAQGREAESERSPEACTVFNRALRVLPDDADSTGALAVPEDGILEVGDAASIADALSAVAPDHSVELLGDSEEERAKHDAPRSTTPVSLAAPAESSGQDDAAESTPSPHASPAEHASPDPDGAGTPVPPSSFVTPGAAAASPEARRSPSPEGRRSPAAPAEARRSTPSRRARGDLIPVGGAMSAASSSRWPLTHEHGAELVGKRIDVWWAAEERWYEGRVAEFNQVSGWYALVKVEHRDRAAHPSTRCPMRAAAYPLGGSP